MNDVNDMLTGLIVNGPHKNNRIGRWAIRLVHLNTGWRYWVFEHSGDAELGDFGTEVEARLAAAGAP